MTEHQEPAPAGGPPPAAPLLEVPAAVRAGAGTAATVEVIVTNTAEQARVVSLSVHGADPAWLPAPSRSQALAPGERIAAQLTLRPAAGTVAARYPIAVAAQALDPSTGQAAGPVTLAELVLVVDAPGEVGLSLEPAEVRTVFGKKIRIRLHNAGVTDAPVDLETQAPSSARLRLAQRHVDVPAGRTVTVSGRVRPGRFRLIGGATRQAFTVTGRSRGAPRHVEGLLTARAMLGPTAAKVVALLAVVGLWVGLAVAFVPKLADHLKGGQSTTVVAQSAAPTGPATGGPGGGTGSGGGPGGGSSGGPAGSSSGRGGGPNAANSVQLNGTVTGNAPSGVTVSLSPTALVSDAAQGATPVGLSTQAVSTMRLTGKIPSSALSAPSAAAASQHRSVTTTTDGAWSFPGVPKPGYYLLAFSKPGYQSVSYVIDSTTASATKPLTVTMAPGQGQLNGVVTGPDGKRVGGATVTLTDGTETVTTSTDSTGDVGSWSVVGLSTPASYLVSATAAGMSTASKLVPLGASGSASVSLTLQAGVASITGTVGALDGTTLGGVTVSATDGASVQRSATTVTEDGLRGRYTLSGLPAPGRYTLTFAGAGYLTQTVQVSLARGQSSATQNVTLFPATATVTGTVDDDPANPPDATAGLCSGSGQPRSGAGLVLTSKDNAYKTTSGDCGDFRFDGVAPGSYVLSVQYAGRATEFRTVTVPAGASAPIVVAAITMSNLPPQLSTASIVGFVTDGSNPSNTLCAAARATDPSAKCDVTFTLRDQDGRTVPLVQDSIAAATAGPTSYTLELAPNADAEPGVYKLSIDATNYLPVTVTVRLPLTGAAAAPAANLFPANTIEGQVNTNPTGGDLTNDGSGTAVTNCVYAVPVGLAAPDLSKPCAKDLVPASECSVTGAQGPAYAEIKSDGSWEMDDVCDGLYFVWIAVQNSWYNPVTSNPALVVVSKGQTYVVPTVTVNLKAQIRLTVDQWPLDGGSSAPEPFATAQTIQLACTDSSGNSVAISPSTFSTSDSPKTIGGFSVNVATTCVGTVTTADNFVASSLTFTAHDVGPTGEKMSFYQTVGTVFGRIVTNWSGSAQPVGGGSVTIAGTVSGSDTSVTVTPAADGCFAITTDGQPPAAADVPAPCTGALTTSAGAVGKLPLTNDSATIDITPASGYRNLAGSTWPAPWTVATGGVEDFTVYPGPVTLSGLTLATDPPTSAPPNGSLDGFGIQIAGSGGSLDQPPGAGSVDLSVGDDGTITWQDDQFTTDNQIAPGTYTIESTESGYFANTYTFTCTPAAQCTVGSTPGQGDPISTHPFTVDKLGSLTVDLAEDGGAPFTDSTVNLYDGTTLVGTQTTTGTSVTFTNLTPTKDLSSGLPYSLRIQAAGYQFGSTDGLNGDKNVALDCGAGATPTVSVDPGGTPTCTATPTRDGAIAGQVILVMGASATDPHQQAPAGIPITGCSGTVAATGGVCPSGSTTFTATTGAGGTFRLTGDATTQGLGTGTWTLSAGLDGYHGGSQSVEVTDTTTDTVTAAADADSCAGKTNICLLVKTVTVTVTVQDSRTGTGVSNLTVNLTGRYTSGPLSPTSQANGVYTFDQIVPDLYDATVAGSGYGIKASGASYADATLDNQSVQLDDGTSATQTQNFDLQIVRHQSTVSGTVTAVHDSSGTASGIAGAKVCLVAAASAPSEPSSGSSCPSGVVADVDGAALSATTGDGGGFSWDTVPDTPTGQSYYLVVVPPYGYQGAVSSAFTVTTSGDDHAEAPIELAQLKNKLTVTVSNSADEDLTSWSPTLTSGSDPAWTLGPNATSHASGSTDSVFTWDQVPAGCWSFTLTNPSGHYGQLAPETMPTASGLTCSAGQIAVTQTASTDVAASYTLDEYQPGVALTLNNNKTLDPTPADVAVTVTVKAGSTTYYSGSQSVPAAGLTTTLPVWVSGSPQLTITPTGAGWSVDKPTTKISGATPTATTGITELGATVTVTLSDKANGVSVSLAPPSGSTFGTPTAVKTTGGGKAEFTDIPYGTWTASAAGYKDGSVTVNSSAASVELALGP